MIGDNDDGNPGDAERARPDTEGLSEHHRSAGASRRECGPRRCSPPLDDENAELLAREGPDALTSDRHFRQAALAAELDPELVASAFAGWCRERGWERSDLAGYLGVTVDQFAALALTSRAMAATETRPLAERFGADTARLDEVLAGR
jgi:hypothetical protein